MSKGKRFKKEENHNKKLKVISIIIIVIFLIVLGIFIYNKNKNKNTYEDLREKMNVAEDDNASQERINKLNELKKENPDIVAWLEIEGTTIAYPVMHTDNNDFYMTHNYKKEYSKDGSLFLDKAYDWTIPSTNLLIYGHNNIGSTEMFAKLENYKDEDYYKEHKKIRLITEKEDSEYEIIAVFLSRVYYKSEKNVFRYYFFINAENEEEFNYYIDNSKKASLYNIEATAEYGDQLLTLSTCEYSQEDGRLAIVAKKIK